MIRSYIKSFIFLFAVMSNPVFAEGDYNLGKDKSQACVACHGIDGNSDNKLYPRLAGQYQNYLVHALQSYKSGERKNPIMNSFAATLSDEDIEDLSKYYSEQKGLKVLPKN